MRFHEQAIFEYNIEFINSTELPHIFAMLSEWYKTQTPCVQYKEVARERDELRHTEVDTLWKEPVDGETRFSRIIDIRSNVTFDRNSWHHGKFGTENRRDIVCYFGLPILEEADLFPLIGDHIVYNGDVYVITNVPIQAENHWAHTNIPVNITCECTKFRFGMNKITTDPYSDKTY